MAVPLQKMRNDMTGTFCLSAENCLRMISSSLPISAVLKVGMTSDN